MPSKHVCKFKKIRYKSGNEVFFCTLPDCNKKMNPKLALGKKCLCWRCEQEFILNEYSLRLVKPHCERCHRAKGNSDIPISEIIPTGPDFSSLPPSLSERLQQTIQQAQTTTEEEEI